ncbi:hypothetical protein NQ317_013145 [Molorchus minor]|uniref:EGF-like domain-containing protein n=1 Tax=Molorchus minor TaxID=1323400 RepID=A0ABQ9JJ38_9CUCU|nr:hypothetical protein NQ317_013145 [Molorchus minor]
MTWTTAPLPLGALFLSLVLCFSATYENTTEEVQLTHDGYYLDALNDAAFGDSSQTLECPSSNVITTRYKCNVKGKWVDCTRRHCCKDYIFVAGRCISKEQDPCSLGLCEQRCTIYLQRIICTCFHGYKFNPENQKRGIKPICVDVNECLDRSGDCEHKCINEIGSHRCTCNPGYKLRGDNRTCELLSAQGGSKLAAAHVDRCYANCDSLVRLNDKLTSLQEKQSDCQVLPPVLQVLQGPPGPPGPPGSRGFPGPDFSSNTLSSPNTDYKYSMLDAFVSLPGDENTQCRCKRGAQGDVGAPGPQGPKGEQGERGVRGPKGERGSFDFLLLLLADVRHDIVHLQNKVFVNGEKPPKFDFETALQKKRIKQKHRFLQQQKILQGFINPSVETKNADETTTTTVPQITTTSEDIEEFRDYDFKISEDTLENYDDFSGGMAYEDYL